MDVTNPGVVNVADQVAGNPSLAANSLSVPRQDDVLEDVAGDGHPRAEDVSLAVDAGASVFPTPTEADAGAELPAGVAPVASSVPNTSPLYAPTPQLNLAATPQETPGVGVTEVTVGPNSNVQTNRNAESERSFTVTTVLDADTGGAVVDPAVPTTGTFDGVFNGGAGVLTLLSPTPLPPVVAPGAIVNVTSTSGGPYTLNGPVGVVTSLTGTVVAVSPSTGGKVTVSSPALLPAGLVDGTPVDLATGVPAYDGAKVVSGVTGLAGPYTSIVSASGGTKVELVSSSMTPAGLVAGKYATLAGVYAGTHRVDSQVSPKFDNYDAAADNGSGGTTFHSANALPAELAVGQTLDLTGATYSGPYVVTNLDAGAHTFDLAVAFAGTSTGTWAQLGSYAFVLETAYVSSDFPGTWTCYTFDVTAAYSVTAAGTWSSHTFTVPGTYTATASGAWTFTPVTSFTTRYKLGLSPADLTSFGVSLLGRELVFGDATLTAADRGASRLISYYGAGYVVVDRSDSADESVPVLAKPQANDVVTIYVQREASEVFTDLGGTADVTIAPPPPTFVPDAGQALQSQGTVDVTVGPQPGAPVLTSGVVVPTARTVQVADQSTTVGLPKDVFA